MGYEYLNIRTEILDTNPLYGQDTYSGRVQQAHLRGTGPAHRLHDHERLDQL